MKSRAAALAAGAIALIVAGGCATPARELPPGKPRADGTYVHVVQPGENLWRISRRYGQDVATVASANRISDPAKIAIGQRLIIPAGMRAARTPPKNGNGGVWTQSSPNGKSGSNRLIWPVKGRVTSGFGLRDGAHHDGLDIPAREGTRIVAAEAGRVIHSNDKLSGYGNMIIIKHVGNLATVYAHNRRNLVKRGDFVEKGQVIAEVGDTGRATSPHVHFEVRRNGKAINPLEFLP